MKLGELYDHLRRAEIIGDVVMLAERRIVGPSVGRQGR